MTCIYALYTKRYPRQLRGARYGHWALPYVEFLILAHSSKKSKEFFGHTTLVTDSYGKELIDAFGIPFDEVKVTLDGCEKKERFWAAGKLHAYTKSITDFGDGFIFMDNDAWFDHKPEDWVLESDYCCQHVHKHENPETILTGTVRQLLREMPHEYPYDIFHDFKDDLRGGNAAFIVLRDEEVWKEFSMRTWALMESPYMDELQRRFIGRNKFTDLYRDFSFWNVVVEELLLACVYRKIKGEMPKVLFDFTGLDFPKGLPNPMGYHHMWGDKRKVERLKKDEKMAVESIGEEISERIYEYFGIKSPVGV